MKNRKDINNSFYIDGRTLKKYYCIEGCGKEITYPTVRDGGHRCKSCSHKHPLSKEHARNISKGLKGMLKTDEWIEIKGYLRNDSIKKYELFKTKYPNIKWKILMKPELQKMGVLK